MINALQLTKLKDKLWYVAPSVATDGTGIFEGLVVLLSWIALTAFTSNTDYFSGLALQQRQDFTSEIITF